MPVHVERRGGKYRLIEPGGQVATTSQGTARDGGGHPNRDKAERQARAINSNLEKAAAIMTMRQLIDKLKEL